ncbi:winged helix-turn-helix transcriptional regulator [Streptomyces sp. NPDC088180]|uniref:winged helix-turn-helix transcriptional regulator n=1 Tax=Streptomyces sp. NPDC088180 TaxID=3365837 RepID=UPI0038299A25
MFVRDGLIAREVEPTVPPRVTYSLTPLGRELALTLGGLVEWITQRIGDIVAARERHDEVMWPCCSPAPALRSRVPFCVTLPCRVAVSRSRGDLPPVRRSGLRAIDLVQG